MTIKELANKHEPAKEAFRLEIDELEQEIYWIEIYAHFVKSELWEDEGRKILSILDIE